MSKKHRPKQPKLRQEAMSWIAQRCGEAEFIRALALYDRNLITALLDYIKAITAADPEAFQEFEERNLEPEVLAERRKAEAEKKKKDDLDKLTIHMGAGGWPTGEEIQDALVNGTRRWVKAEVVAQEKAEREAAEKSDELIPTPEAVF